MFWVQLVQFLQKMNLDDAEEQAQVRSQIKCKCRRARYKVYGACVLFSLISRVGDGLDTRVCRAWY